MFSRCGVELRHVNVCWELPGDFDVGKPWNFNADSLVLQRALCNPQLKPSGAGHRRGGRELCSGSQCLGAGAGRLWFQNAEAQTSLLRPLWLTNRVSTEATQTGMVTCDRKCLSFQRFPAWFLRPNQQDSIFQPTESKVYAAKSGKSPPVERERGQRIAF